MGAVRRYHDLADAGVVHAAQQFEELDLARRRQRQLRLIKDEKCPGAGSVPRRSAESLRRGNGRENRAAARSTVPGPLRRDSAPPRRSSRRGRTSRSVIFGSQLARSASRQLPAHFLDERASDRPACNLCRHRPHHSRASAAMPSSRVDLPVPFSPTMMVMACTKPSSKSAEQKRQAERINRRKSRTANGRARCAAGRAGACLGRYACRPTLRDPVVRVSIELIGEKWQRRQCMLRARARSLTPA